MLCVFVDRSENNTIGLPVDQSDASKCGSYGWKLCVRISFHYNPRNCVNNRFWNSIWNNIWLWFGVSKCVDFGLRLGAPNRYFIGRLGYDS